MLKMVACQLNPEGFDENRDGEFPEEMLLELAKWHALHRGSSKFSAEEFYVRKEVVGEKGKEVKSDFVGKS